MSSAIYIIVRTHPQPVLASRWGPFSSRGIEAHSVLPLKASVAHKGGVYDVLNEVVSGLE